MLFIVGSLVVIGCVIGGYMAMGGHVEVLWQPFEFVIIGGAALGAYIIGNSMVVIKSTGKGFKALMKGPQYSKAAYMELLGVLFAVFKLAKTKGDLALEAHVENPEGSAIFTRYPKFISDHEAVEFLCDYLRMLTLGTSNAHEMENVMEAELEAHHNDQHQISGAFQAMGDGFPALGIVAAVLGVIKTMGSITEPPEVLGHLIGGALVGTFFGVFMAYGFVGPMASSMQKTFDSDSHYLNVIKAGLVAHMQGYAPQVSVEFARKTLPHNVRPTFKEIEEMMASTPAD